MQKYNYLCTIKYRDSHILLEHSPYKKLFKQKLIRPYNLSANCNTLRVCAVWYIYLLILRA